MVLYYIPFLVIRRCFGVSEIIKRLRGIVISHMMADGPQAPGSAIALWIGIVMCVVLNGASLG